MIFAYLKFLLRSGNEHGLHSPFVFDLYTQVIRDKQKHTAYEEIEGLRQKMLASTESIEVGDDFGAGSRVSAGNTRKVSNIAKHALERKKVGQLMYRLVAFFQPDNLFDLGTSLGITTLYMHRACPASKIYTFEGSKNIAQLASQNFIAHNFECQPIIGNIDDTLLKTLSEIDRLDFAFFDANHRLEPTWRYFEQCLQKAHEDTVLVFDDIYWSAEMTEAWEKIKNHPSVTLTIDLFFVGIVFFRKKQPKQHFTLRL